MNLRMLGVEKEAGAGEAGFRFLELGNVDGSDGEATGFDPGAGAWEGSGKNNRAAKGQRIGGMRLGRGDVEPFIASERRSVEPGAVGEERIGAGMRDGRLQ